MSITLMGQVWKCQFTKAEQSVMLAMADHAKDDGTDCYPSIERIAWKTDYSARQVQRVMKDLTERGILILVRKGGRGRATEYRIDLGKASPKPDFVAKKGDTMSSYSLKGDTVSSKVAPIKGDIVSPYQPKDDIVSSNSDSKRVTFDPIKGDISALKDDIAMSPQSLTNKPSENGSVSSSSDIWVQCVTELSRTLPGGFVSTLTDSTLEAAGSAKDASGKLIDIYRVLIAADRAPRGVSHFSRQCGPSIRRTLSTFLRKPVLIEIAAAEPQPESEPTP